jgi:hypothetical protein
VVALIVGMDFLQASSQDGGFFYRRIELSFDTSRCRSRIFPSRNASDSMVG